MKKFIVSFLITLSLTSGAWAQPVRSRTLIDLVNPAIITSPLLRGIISWWINLPGINNGGISQKDLIRANNATLTGMAAIPTASSGWGRTTSRPGGWGEWRFDGANDHLLALQNGHFVLNASPFTIMCWFKDDTAAASLSTPHRLVYWDDGTNGIGMVLGRTASDNTKRAIGLQKAGNSAIALGSTTIGTGWQHAAVTYNGVSTYAAYINGILATGTVTEAMTVGSSAGNLYIGTWDGSNGWVVGMMDDVRIYKRNLVAREILEIYKDSRTGYSQTIKQFDINSFFASLSAQFFQFMR